MRGVPKYFVGSKVMCWVAADRGAIIAKDRGDTKRVERWRAAADKIKAEVCERGVDERGSFTQHYDGTALDASLVLFPLMGFLPPDDERVRTTVLAIANELTQDGLVLRYRVDATDDGLSGEEGTFTHLALIDAASRLIEAERRRASDGTS